MALDLSGLTLLLVEDNVHMRRLIRDILLELGVGTVLEAPDGAEGLAAIADNAVDIVICDWVMEPLDGLDFVRRVRTSDETGAPMVPVIMLTGHTERHRIIEARDAGVTEFLAKPVTAGGIYSRIRSIVEAPRSFVRVGQYAGPDRRRRRPTDSAPRRRALDADAAD